MREKLVKPTFPFYKCHLFVEKVHLSSVASLHVDGFDQGKKDYMTTC